jgi:hypothetical protein
MGCFSFMHRKNRHKTVITHTRKSDEKAAFNIVNRSLTVDLITIDINDAAVLYLKAYGKLPANACEESSAKLLFVQLVASKAAHLAVAGFNRALRDAKSPFDEEYIH